MDVRIEIAIAKMRKSLSGTITTSDLANLTNLSLEHFSRLFKKETGQSPGRYLKDLRMERARILLVSSHFSVKEVVRMAGLHDPSHFVRDFERKYGLSPARHRKQVRASVQSNALETPESGLANE